METKQNQQQNFNEVEYLVDVAKIRHEIVKLMIKNKMIIKESINEDLAAEINPVFGRIAKNGSFGVEFSYGYPVSLMTPFGKVRIGVPAMADNRGNYTEQENFYHDMKTKFGMVEVEPKFKKQMLGEFGPYCAITRLPWKKKEMLPETFQRVKNVDYENYEIQTENKRANEILMQASAVVTKLGVNGKKSKCVIGNEKANLKQTAQIIDDSEIGW